MGKCVILVLFMCSELSLERILIFLGKIYSLLLFRFKDCKLGNRIFGFCVFVGDVFMVDVIDVGWF